MADEVLALEVALTKAAGVHDIAKVREMLRQGADPDGRIGTKARRYAFAHDRRGQSPVAGVRASPLLAVLGPRYDQGPLFDPSLGDELRQYLQADIVLLLLSAGADPNLHDRDAFGDFPLLFAAEADNYQAVKVLLDAGADPNLSTEGFGQFDPTTSPSNALGYAVKNEATWTIELLLDAGAFPFSGGYYYTPLERAAKTGNPAVLRLLMSDCEDSYDDYRDEWTKAMTHLIIAWGRAADDEKDFHARGFQACFKLLVEAGATVDRSRLDQNYLIYRVLDANDPELGAWFFAELAKVPAVLEGNNNPILYLGTQVQPDGLKKAFAMGVELNATDHHGRTMLHHAAIDGKLKTSEFLLKAGAKHDIKDHDGKTPLDVANEFVRYDFAELLKNLPPR